LKKKHIVNGLVVFLFFLFSYSFSQELSPEMIKKIKRNTYEVVVLKRESNIITYEKKLPFDLLSYTERNDKYFSIGSAFTISGNKLLSAAHVLPIHIKSQYKDIFIRDINKNVYKIDKIEKFSNHRDFIVFTVKDLPKYKHLQISEDFEMDSTVYAVGNAYGEGTVIRKGLLTSKTPEQLDGAWDWLRFSAAASPGNSGGPLLDEDGNVLGIVVMKSPNENLNYALPIKEVLGFKEQAELFNKIIYKYGNMNYEKLTTIDIKVSLPAKIDVLTKDLQEQRQQFFDQHARQTISENYKDIFPLGDNSDEAVYSAKRSVFPYMMAQNSSGLWSPYSPEDISTSKLFDDGSLSYGWMRDILFIKLHKPDSLSVSDLFDDSKKYGELLLKGVTLYRTVGGQDIRVTSLGKASKQYWKKDNYGRNWQFLIWDVPYNDMKLMSVSLPMPNGLIAISDMIETDNVESLEYDYHVYINFIFGDYFASFEDWGKFLKQKELLSDNLKNIKFSFKKKNVKFSDDRISVNYTEKQMNISDESSLRITVGIFPDKDSEKPIFTTNMYLFGEEIGRSHYFFIARYSKPIKSLSKDFHRFWSKLTDRRYPYDQSSYISDRTTIIEGFSSQYQESNLDDKTEIFTLGLVNEGKKEQDEMAKSFHKFQKCIHIKNLQ